MVLKSVFYFSLESHYFFFLLFGGLYFFTEVFISERETFLILSEFLPPPFLSLFSLLYLPDPHLLRKMRFYLSCLIFSASSFLFCLKILVSLNQIQRPPPSKNKMISLVTRFHFFPLFLAALYNVAACSTTIQSNLYVFLLRMGFTPYKGFFLYQYSVTTFFFFYTLFLTFLKLVLMRHRISDLEKIEMERQEAGENENVEDQEQKKRKRKRKKKKNDKQKVD